MIFIFKFILFVFLSLTYVGLFFINNVDHKMKILFTISFRLIKLTMLFGSFKLFQLLFHEFLCDFSHLSASFFFFFKS